MRIGTHDALSHPQEPWRCRGTDSRTCVPQGLRRTSPGHVLGVRTRWVTEATGNRPAVRGSMGAWTPSALPLRRPRTVPHSPAGELECGRSRREKRLECQAHGARGLTYGPGHLACGPGNRSHALQRAGRWARFGA
jgi:hypothetical protein